jgi:hypothetical protein
MILSDIQKDKIRYHLTNWNELKDKELIEELFDHYVIDIEKKMKEGKTFDEALKEVYKSFGGIYGVQNMEQTRLNERKKVANKLIKSTLYEYVSSYKIIIIGLLVTLSVAINGSYKIILSVSIITYIINFILYIKIAQESWYGIIIKPRKKIIPSFVLANCSRPLIAFLCCNSIIQQFIKDLEYKNEVYFFLFFLVLLGQVIAFELLFKYYQKDKLKLA